MVLPPPLSRPSPGPRPGGPSSGGPAERVSPATGGRPGTWRRVANLQALIDLPAVLGRLHAAGPPVARLDAGPYPLAYLRRPEDVKAMLDGRLEGVAERGRFFEDIGRVVGTTSVLTCEGEAHRQLRRLLAAAFRPEQVADYAVTMMAATGELAARLRDGDELLLGETMGRLTLEIAARALLGLERAEQLDDFASVLSAGTQLFYRLLLPRPWSDALWRSRLSPANRRLAAAQARVDRFVDDLLAERRVATPGSGTRTGRPANLLDVLLAAEEGGGLEGTVVRDQIVTFLFAGHETTAQALTWAFVLLDRHKGVRRRLEAELDALPGPPGVADLPALPLARAVVRETLRLCPPAWFLARETVTDTVVGGCPVPRGTLLLASPLALHRDPAAFADPLAFDPDRWLGSDGEAAGPEAYLPFGHGRHNCIGSSFALAELVLVVATLAREWRVHLLEPGRVRERATVTLRPRRPVRVVLERRRPSS